MNMRLCEVRRVVTRHAQVGRGTLQQRLFALMGIVAVGAVALSCRIMNVRPLQSEVGRIMTVRAQIGSGFLQPQRTNLTMRLVARQALALLPRFVGNFALKLALLVAIETLSLLAEARA